MGVWLTVGESEGVSVRVGVAGSVVGSIVQDGEGVKVGVEGSSVGSIVKDGNGVRVGVEGSRVQEGLGARVEVASPSKEEG